LYSGIAVPLTCCEVKDTPFSFTNNFKHMFFKLPPSDALKTLPAEVQPHVATIRNFVALFPDNEMQKEINDFISTFLQHLEEDELPQILQLAPARSYHIFFELCRAVEALGKYYE
jgi:hypothetical protein